MKRSKDNSNKYNKKLIIILLLILVVLSIGVTVCINLMQKNDQGKQLETTKQNSKEEIYEDELEGEYELEPPTNDEVAVEDLYDINIKSSKLDKNNGVIKIKTSRILLTNEKVTLLVGDDYDLYKDIKIDTGRKLVVTSNITDTKTLPIGTHEVIYTAIDINKEKITKSRFLIILHPREDEDNDGYTNEEEIKNDANPLDGDKKPKYSSNPTIDVSNCITNMTVYDQIPDFTKCVIAKDDFYGKDGLTIDINTNDINTNNTGIYKVKVEAKDILGNSVSEEFELNVNKRKVTINIDDKTSRYLSDLEPLTSNENEVTAPNTDIGVSLTTYATNKSDVGEYLIEGTWSNNNYDVTFKDGIYTITPLLLDDLTSSEINSKLDIKFNDVTTTYNGKNQKIIIDEDIPEGLSISYKNNEFKEAGIYNAIAIITGKDNYQGKTEVAAKLIINKAPITIKANDVNAIYEEAPKSLTYIISNGEIFNNDDLNIVLEKEQPSNFDVGTYSINITAQNKNYEINITNGTYTITPRPLNELTPSEVKEILNLKFDNTETIYNGNKQEVIVEGNITSDFSISYQNNEAEEVGIYNAKAIITGKNNYQGEQLLEATLTINKAPITLQANNINAIYGENPKELTYIVSSGQIFNNDNLNIELEKEEPNNYNVGTYSINIDAQNKNYEIFLVDGTYTIIPMSLNELTAEEIKEKFNINFNSLNTTYNGQKQAITIEGNIPSDFNISYQNNEALEVGTYNAVAVIKGNNNYQGEQRLESTLTINKSPITIKANDVSATYGENKKTLTYTITSGEIFNGDNLNIKLEKEAPSNYTVGAYDINVAAQNKNYEISLVNGVYTIIKATPYYVVPTDLTAEEDALLTDILLPSGFTYYEIITEPLKPGTYEIKLTYTPDDTHNYEIVKDIPAELVVTPAVYYTITFVDKDHNVISTQSVRKHRRAVEPNTIEEYEENGKVYHFSGWVGNYVDVIEDATITPLYIEEGTNSTYAYVLDPKYYLPEDGAGYDSDHYTNALETADGEKIPLSIKIGGLTTEQAQSIRNQKTTIVALGETNVMKYLTQSTKDQLHNITHGVDEVGEYTIEWYVLKYQPDGWHLDGYKVYDEFKINIEYSPASTNNIRYDHLTLHFTNAVESVTVIIDGVSKTPINSTGYSDVGNHYITSYTKSDSEKIIKITYVFKHQTYTKEYIIVDETITEKK